MSAPLGAPATEVTPMSDFITHLAATWEASLDLNPDDIDGETRYVTWKVGQLLDQLAPGTTEDIIARRINAPGVAARTELNALRHVVATWLGTCDVQAWPDGLWATDGQEGRFGAYTVNAIGRAIEWANEVGT